MEPAGARLKKIRLEKGVSLEEAHKSTKVHLNVLKAIEEDSLINFNPVYIKGFLKIYCKFLGVDPKDYIADYKEVRSPAQVSAAGEKKKFSNLKPDPDTSAIIREIRRQKKTILTLLGIIIFIFLVFNLGKTLSSRRLSYPVRARRVQEKVIKTEKKAEALKEQKKTQAGSRNSAEGFSKEDASSIIRLSIRARENCLVQLKSDGKIVFYGILARGRAESWHARNKMELSLGNAGVVDLEVNGKPISNLGKRGQSIKNISISKEGLNIER